MSSVLTTSIVQTAVDALSEAVALACRVDPVAVPHEATIVLVTRLNANRRIFEVAIDGRKSEDLFLDLVEKLSMVFGIDAENCTCAVCANKRLVEESAHH